MADYISREALEKAVSKPSMFDINKDDVLALIAEIPAADVAEVRHGVWIIKTDDYDNEYMMCSCCKDEFYPVDEDTVDTTPNYCQTCGAKMDGERREQSGV